MRIKEIREAKGISQRKAALDLNLSPVVYGRYENGTREPSNVILLAIADYFGVTVDELLGREPEQPVDMEKVSPSITMMARAMEKMTPEQQKTMINLGKAAFKEYFDLDFPEDHDAP